MAIPSDPLYDQQWHLRMLGNIEKIWTDYRGNGVSAVVYDDGLQFNHPDLAGNYDASQHFRFNGVTYSPMPLAGSDAHGTACAGLLGAVANNGQGGVGVASEVTLTGLNYLNDLQNAYNFTTQTTSAKYTAVMRWAARFDIWSNSWGVDPNFAAELNLNEPGNASAVDAAHFAWVSLHGRNGLGTIIVKAAGNETMNANGDGTNASRHTITVAAVEESGTVADYSNYGASLLISGPAAAVTTDRTGGLGYNRNSADGDPLGDLNYTSTFNGTSAATPVVSGVAALMLDANDDLGWRDVQTILAMSASHIGSPVGAGTTGAEVQAWQIMGGTQWNGGGAAFSQSYGFGMVDAYAAVRMAEVWSRMYGPARTSVNEQHVTKVMSAAQLAIPDSDENDATSELEIDFNVTQNIEIDTIYVTLNIAHDYAEDLAIYLRGPDGEFIMLSFKEGGADGLTNGLTWTFAAEAYRGMSSKGSWQIAIDDLGIGDTGTVFDAKLEFFGSANTANDVYHFTDQFQAMKAQEASRGLIDDRNGGVDWLNFAAVTKNLTISMAAGGAVKLNGVQVARLGAGTADFENLQAGDGADRITGNGLANKIFAGRGADKIVGGAAADQLHGERGNDTLLGGAGGDRLFGEAGNDLLTGGGGTDSFVFSRGFGHDRITGWENNTDTLRIDDALWGGGKTVGQVLSSFADVVNGSVVIAFSAANSVTLQGMTNIAALGDDLVII